MKYGAGACKRDPAPVFSFAGPSAAETAFQNAVGIADAFAHPAIEDFGVLVGEAKKPVGAVQYICRLSVMTSIVVKK